MKTPQKHAVVIHAWAEGAQIEVFDNQYGKWINYFNPSFLSGLEYRIKPEPKADVVKYARIFLPRSVFDVSRVRMESDNLRLTFNGDTGALKAAEVIQ
jgi:hypothetical protein